MKSPMYWYPIIYNIIMRALYGKNLDKNFKIIAKEIGNLSVLDLCSGTSALFNYLNGNDYVGLDINQNFVEYARKRGINARVADVLKEKWPKKDCIVISSSLYQFIPNHEKLLQKMLKNAGKKVIISEPIKNLSSSKNFVISFIARKLSHTGKEDAEKRLNRKQMMYLCKKYKGKKIKIVGRNLICCFEIKGRKKWKN